MLKESISEKPKRAALGEAEEEEDERPMVPVLPDKTDMFIAFATVPGYM